MPWEPSVGDPVIRKRFGVSTGTPQTVTTSGTTTIRTPAPGRRIRLRWVGMSSPSTNTASVLAEVKLGTDSIYLWDLGAPGAFSNGVVREGAADAALTLTLSDNQAVRFNYHCEEF